MLKTILITLAIVLIVVMAFVILGRIAFNWMLDEINDDHDRRGK